MKKLIAKSVFLAVLILLVNRVVIGMLPTGWANGRVRAKLEVIERPDCDKNLLFFGSSRTYRHIDPALFDELLAGDEIRSFNLAGPSTFNPERYAILDAILDRPPESLRTIICELDILRRPAPKNRHTARNLYWRTPQYTSIVAQSIWADETRPPHRRLRDIVLEIEELAAKALNAGMGPDILDALIQEPDRHALGPARDGFLSLSEEHASGDGPGAAEIAARRHGFLADPQRIDEVRDNTRRAFADRESFVWPDGLHVELMLDLIARANEKGIHLVFLLPARVPPCDRVLALYDDLPVANRIELADPRSHPDLYDFSMSFDHGHLDATGARRYTTLLAERYRELRDR